MLDLDNIPDDILNDIAIQMGWGIGQDIQPYWQRIRRLTAEQAFTRYCAAYPHPDTESVLFTLQEAETESGDQLSDCEQDNLRLKNSMLASQVPDTIAICDQAITDLQGVMNIADGGCDGDEGEIIIEIAQYIASNLEQIVKRGVVK